MKFILKIFVSIIVVILGINFLLDLSFINKQFDKSSKEFLSKYLTPHKYTTNLEGEIKKIKRVHIGERIRDMIYYNEKLYLYLEDTASLAEISFN